MAAPVVVTFKPCSNPQDLFPKKPNAHTVRDQFSVPLNETVSLTDHVYFDSTDCFPEYGKLIDPKKKSDEERLEELSLRDKIVADYHDMISQHITRRIAFFFDQLVCCYQTKLHFEIGDTLDQGQSPKRVTLKTKENTPLTFQRNAAHSNTLPCLLASDSAKWTANPVTCDRFIFLKGTDSYRLWNSTMNMPRFVNNVDIIIDGTGSVEKLRNSALDLLNKAARGKITPDKAIEIFMNRCLKWIKKGLDTAETKLKDRTEEKKCLQYYREKMKYRLQDFLNHRDEILQIILNVRLSPSAPENFLKTIYQIRYRSIRDAQLAESSIIKKIEVVRKEILSHYGRKPDGFTAAFRSLLIEQAYLIDQQENEDAEAKHVHKLNRQRIANLYNFSSTDYEENRVAVSYKTRYLKTKTDLSETHLQKITAVVSTVLKEMEGLRKKEIAQSGLLTKELRKAKGWSKEQLAEKIKELFPKSALDAARIKKIESDQALLTSSEMKELHHVFDERIQSGAIVQELRLSKGWSKEQLVEKIKELFLRSSFQNLTISQIEKSGKLISKSAAKALREIFAEEAQSDRTIKELLAKKGWTKKQLVEEKIKESFLHSELDASTIETLEKRQSIPRAIEKELHQVFSLSLELFTPHSFYE